jgi:two-component system response regulator
MTMQTVLLVEDNAGDEALTLRALHKNGIAARVDVARDGAEALDYLFRAGAYRSRPLDETPTVVLLDLNLPKLGGLEVLASIRADAQTSLLPVVILTSSDEECDYLSGYQNGANSYVRKPVEFNEFAAAVQRLGLYWLVLNRTPPDVAPSRTTAAA